MLRRAWPSRTAWKMVVLNGGLNVLAATGYIPLPAGPQLNVCVLRQCLPCYTAYQLSVLTIEEISKNRRS